MTTPIAPTKHATTGRKKHSDKPSRFELSIPQSIYDKMELHLLDPVTGKANYGSRSKLIQMLLREYFEKLRTGGTGDLDINLTAQLATAETALLPTALLLNTARDALIKGGFVTSADTLINLLKERTK